MTPITQEMIDQYREEGYTILRGLLDPPLIEAMRTAAEGALARMNEAELETNKLWQGGWLEEGDRSRQVVDAIHDVHFHDAVFTRMLTLPALLQLLEATIGANVQLHHTKLLAKPAGKGGGFPMHQDYPYFPHEKHSMAAVSVYLDDADEENGCIRVVPGTHKIGPIECDPGGFYLPPKDYPVESGIAATAKAGDAVMFNYLTVHGSGPNRSNRPRRNVLVQVRDPADPPTRELHESRGQGMMLVGHNPLPRASRWEEKAVT